MKNLKKNLFSIFIALSMFIFPISGVKANNKGATDHIAEVTIYSTINNDHSWLVVKNTSGSSIYVGKRYISHGDSISIGTFGNISQHKGIWYNIELVYSVSTYVSITREIKTTSQLNTFNNTINSRDSWSIINNTCSTFAASVWNSVFNDTVSVGITPSGLAKSIKKYNYSTNQSMPTKTAYQIYYHGTNGTISCPNPNFSGSSGSSKIINNGLTSFTNYELSILEGDK